MAGKPYAPLGVVMDELASGPPYYVRGPHRIARHIQERVPDYPTGAAVSKWMYGQSLPRNDYIEIFAEAFELGERERTALAYAYAYKALPPAEAFTDFE